MTGPPRDRSSGQHHMEVQLEKLPPPSIANAPSGRRRRNRAAKSALTKGPAESATKHICICKQPHMVARLEFVGDDDLPLDKSTDKKRTLIDAIDLIGKRKFADEWTGKEVIARFNLPICHATETQRGAPACELERKAAERFKFAAAILDNLLRARRLPVYVEDERGATHAIVWSLLKKPEAERVIHLGDNLSRWGDPHRFKFPVAFGDPVEGRAFVRY